MGAYLDELLLDGVLDVQVLDELGDGLLVDGLSGAGELLELLVGVGVSLAAEDGLYGLRDDGPVGLEVLVDLLGVDQELGVSLEDGLEGDQGVGQGRAQGAQDGGVGQVALEAGDG